MTRLKNFLLTSVQVIFAVTIAAMLVLCLFLGNWEYFCRKAFPYHNAVYLVTGIVILGVLFCAVYHLVKNKWFARHSSLVMASASLLLGLMLLLFSYHYYFKTGWDSSVLVRTANNIANHDMASLDNWYYSIYPNNVLLTYIFSIIIRFCRLIGLGDYYFGLIAFQSLLTGAGGYLVFRCADMLFSSRAYAVWAWIVYVVMAGLSPWVVIPYSDSVGVFMVLLSLYLYLRLSHGKKTGICLFLLAASVYLGYKVKPQIVIIGIAMLLAAAVELVGAGKIQWKRVAAGTAAAAAGLLAAWIAMQAVEGATGLRMNKDQAFGWPHYIMMGLNDETNGGYCNDDVIFSQTVSGRKERAEANLQAARQRAAEYGIPGLASFWCKKMLTVYNDGTFAWTNEGEFFQEMYEKGNPDLGQALKSYYYPEGSHYTWFLNISQAFWMAVLFLGACAAWGRKRTEMLVLMMAVVGLTLFELLFEARARYLFAYVPVYILLAGEGIRSMIYYYGKITGKAEDKK